MTLTSVWSSILIGESTNATVCWGSITGAGSRHTRHIASALDEFKEPTPPSGTVKHHPMTIPFLVESVWGYIGSTHAFYGVPRRRSRDRTE